MKDFQKSKVYKWEDAVIAPKDQGIVSFENIQNIVNYVWRGEGLDYPPQVLPLSRQCKKVIGTGERLNLHFRETGVPTWVIIHEISHAMSVDLHGEQFVGNYMRMISKFMGVNLLYLMASAKDMGVKFNVGAKPVLICE